MRTQTQIRGLSALLLASTTLASSATNLEPAKSPAELFRIAAPSVMTVLAHHADPAQSKIGSAVSIGQGRAVTNCHVIAGASLLQVKFQDEFYLAQREYTDEPRDLCSITVPGAPAKPARIADAHWAKVGDRVYAIGSPRGYELTLSEGLVSGFRDQDAGQVIQTTAAISPGSSGGALFDEFGWLIGITTSKVPDGDLIGFAMPSAWINELQARHAPPQRVITAAPTPSPLRDQVLGIEYRWPSSTSPISPNGVVWSTGKIYTQVTTQTAAAAVVTATFTYGNQDQHVTTLGEVVDAGTHVTTFELAKPGAWPVGSYKVDLSINNKPAREARFCVQDASWRCKVVQGSIYAYKLGGTTHYTATYPSNPDAVQNLRTIPYTMYELEPTR